MEERSTIDDHDDGKFKQGENTARVRAGRDGDAGARRRRLGAARTRLAAAGTRLAAAGKEERDGHVGWAPAARRKSDGASAPDALERALVQDAASRPFSGQHRFAHDPAKGHAGSGRRRRVRWRILTNDPVGIILYLIGCRAHFPRFGLDKSAGGAGAKQDLLNGASYINYY